MNECVTYTRFPMTSMCSVVPRMAIKITESLVIQSKSEHSGVILTSYWRHRDFPSAKTNHLFLMECTRPVINTLSWERMTPADKWRRTGLRFLDFLLGVVPLLTKNFTFLNISHSSWSSLQVLLFVHGILTFPVTISSTLTWETTEFIVSATNLQMEQSSGEVHSRGWRLA